MLSCSRLAAVSAQFDNCSNLIAAFDAYKLSSSVCYYSPRVWTAEAKSRSLLVLRLASCSIFLRGHQVKQRCKEDVRMPLRLMLLKVLLLLLCDNRWGRSTYNTTRRRRLLLLDVLLSPSLLSRNARTRDLLLPPIALTACYNSAKNKGL
jgi:hypothetical protein